MTTPFNVDSFLPETFIIPEDRKELRIKLYQYLNDISTAVNSKDSGYYVTEETITGKQFVPTFNSGQNTNAQYRDVFRKIVDFGALPNTTTKTVAHGITTTEDYSIVKFYAVATDPAASTLQTAIPIPYVNVTTPADGVELSMDATNVSITTTTANYTAYIRCFVTIEYIKLI